MSFFGEKNSKIPKVKLIPVPKISPKIFWGFSGIKPQKNSKFNLTSSPKNPQKFSKPCPRPCPVPKIRRRGRGKSGIGAPFPHPSTYYHFISKSCQIDYLICSHKAKTFCNLLEPYLLRQKEMIWILIYLKLYFFYIFLGPNIFGKRDM